MRWADLLVGVSLGWGGGTHRLGLAGEYFAYLQRQGLSVKYVLAADSDVIILKDPFIVYKTISWDSVESYQILDGALILWSLQGLKNYANFFL